MTRIRAAMHVHSEWSYDASWTLDSIAAAFGRRKYRVVLMAEHDQGWDEARWSEYVRACRAASRDGVLLVPGVEYSDPADAVHVPVWSSNFLGASLPTDELLKRVQQDAAFAVLAHPQRRDAWRCFRAEWAKTLSGIEVWNRKYDGWAPSRAGLAIAAKYPSLATCIGLDFHTHKQFSPMAITIEVGDHPSVDSVRRALRAGRFTASFGGFHPDAFATGHAWRVMRAAEWGRRRTGRVIRRMKSRRNTVV
jgi:hypothetical protein